jgi:hypothetical protein
MSGNYSNVKWYGLPTRPAWSDLLASYPKSDSQLIRETVHDFYNFNEVDNFTNIREFGQTAELAKTIMERLREFGVVTIGKRKFPFVSRRWKQYLLTGSNAYLAYSFGIAPLVKDMSAMAHSVRALKGRFQKAVDDSRREVTVHGRTVGSITVDRTHLPGYGSDASDTSGYWYGKLILLAPPSVVCSVRGHRAIKYETRLFNSLDYLMQRFISAGPASALWEAIPFSFVLDWFVDTSRIIDSLDNALTGSTKSINDISLSQSYSIRYETYVTQRTGEYLSMANGLFANTWFQFYHREPVVISSIAGASGRFGKRQATYLAALLHQMVANLVK